jgi:hypothetical protein
MSIKYLAMLDSEGSGVGQALDKPDVGAIF